MHVALEKENAKIRSTIGSLIFVRRKKGTGELKRMLSNRWSACYDRDFLFVQMARFERRGFRRRPQASRNLPSEYPATVSLRKISEPQPGVNLQSSSSALYFRPSVPRHRI